MTKPKSFLEVVKDANIRRNILARPATPNLLAAAPKPTRQLHADAQRRMIINQLLVLSLLSNTYRLVDDFEWTRDVAKIVTGLHHRTDDLFVKYFELTPTYLGNWLNQVSTLIDGAVVSVLAIAEQDDSVKIEQMKDLLRDLAKLAGTYVEDQPNNPAAG